MRDLADLRFYTTHPHPCSYLSEKEATTLFLDPYQPLDTETYTQLSELGFRRSGQHIYRPHCQHCSACIPARLPVNTFQPNRQQRRVVKRNIDLEVMDVKPRLTDEYYALYSYYIERRHADGDMYPPSQEQFQNFLACEFPFVHYYEFRHAGRLLAVAVTDVLSTGLSAVYTFYDPDEEHRSLGRYAILWQLQEARRLGLPALYLGYCIRNCQKMSYKTEYRPIELLVNQRWIRAN